MDETLTSLNENISDHENRITSLESNGSWKLLGSSTTTNISGTSTSASSTTRLNKMIFTLSDSSFTNNPFNYTFFKILITGNVTLGRYTSSGMAKLSLNDINNYLLTLSSSTSITCDINRSLPAAQLASNTRDYGISAEEFCSTYIFSQFDYRCFGYTSSSKLYIEPLLMNGTVSGTIQGFLYGM